MPEGATGLLEVRDLEVAYGAARVVHGVSISVAASEAVALLGRNGAGKSSTLGAIAGAISVRAGAVSLAGTRLDRLPTFAIARQGVALVPQGRRIFRNLTVRENLAVAQRNGESLDAVYARFPILRERGRQLATTLSSGEQQMLALARALLGKPRLLLMDEPSEGLAPQVLHQIREIVVGLRGSSELAILMSEQNLGLALAVTDRAYIIERGQIVYEGPSAELAQDRATQHRFLGV
ncbi:MAG: ABC transporter ATP-binding protein [Candidatus Dormiibacterota bacterium]